MSVTDIGFSARGRTLDPTTRGVIAMVVGMAFQVTNDAIVKLVSARLPASEIMAIRGVMAVGLMLAIILSVGQGARLKAVASPLVALRSVLEAACCVVYLTALSGLGLAEFTSIVQATPLIMTAFAVALGWQKVGPRRWAAIGVGFVGVLLVAKPSPTGVNAYAGLALLAAVIMAVRDLVTRRIPSHAPSLVVTLGATVTVTLVGATGGVIEPSAWVAPNAREIVLLTSVAALVCACNMMIVLAFRLGDMAVVGPFRYSVILGSLILGYAVWGDRPDALGLAGAALIVGSGLYALRRERVRGEPASAAEGAAGPV